MTPQQAADGLIELVLPQGGRVLVDFHGRAAGDAAIEADVIRMMLDVEDAEADICAAVDDYAHASGLAATYYLGREALIVTFAEAAPGVRHGISAGAWGRTCRARATGARRIFGVVRVTLNR